MSKYLLRRTLILIPVLFGISAILFTILVMAPGDPFEELATNPNVPPEVRMNLRAKFGLDDPLPVRYVRWVASMMPGDWGFSFVSRVDVDTLDLAATADDPDRPGLGPAPGDPDRDSHRDVSPPYAPTRSSIRSRRPWRSSASPCPRSSPASSSSCSSASTWTGCRSSIGPTSVRRAGAGTGSISARRSCR